MGMRPSSETGHWGRCRQHDRPATAIALLYNLKMVMPNTANIARDGERLLHPIAG